MKNILKNPFSLIIILEILAVSISILTKNPGLINIVLLLAAVFIVLCVGFYKNIDSLIASILLVIGINLLNYYLQINLQLFGRCDDWCGMTYFGSIPILVISSIISIIILVKENK
jgi:hypothetical protein